MKLSKLPLLWKHVTASGMRLKTTILIIATAPEVKPFNQRDWKVLSTISRAIVNLVDTASDACDKDKVQNQITWAKLMANEHQRATTK